MNFGFALLALKQGKAVERMEWPWHVFVLCGRKLLPMFLATLTQLLRVCLKMTWFLMVRISQ